MVPAALDAKGGSIRQEFLRDVEAEEEHEGQVFTGQLLAFLRGGSRGDVSEATAKTAVTEELLGRRPPKRR